MLPNIKPYLLSVAPPIAAATINLEQHPQANFNWKPLREYFAKIETAVPKSEFNKYQIYASGTSKLDIVQFKPGQYIVSEKLKKHIESYFPVGANFYPVMKNGVRCYFLVVNKQSHCLDYKASTLLIPEDEPDAKKVTPKFVLQSEKLSENCFFRIPELPSALFVTTPLNQCLSSEEFIGVRVSEIETSSEE